MEQESEVDVEPGDAVSVTGSEQTQLSAESRDDESINGAGSHESVPPVHSYQIKPLLADKFKARPIKDIIGSVLTEELTGKVYNADAVKRWTVNIANEINTRVTQLKMKRYKHVVQVVLGEHRGAGIKSAVRCVWDSDTDGYTSDFFSNDTLFCVVAVYAVYLY